MMAAERPVLVHLLPGLVPVGALAGGVAVVIDVLRATTVIVHALAAGCRAVIPVGEIDEAARRAWDSFENHGRCLDGALEVGAGGERLRALGFGADIRSAAQVDRFAIVPELRRDPLRIERGSVGIAQSHWPR